MALKLKALNRFVLQFTSDTTIVLLSCVTQPYCQYMVETLGNLSTVNRVIILHVLYKNIYGKSSGLVAIHFQSLNFEMTGVCLSIKLYALLATSSSLEDPTCPHLRNLDGNMEMA